MGFSTFKVIEPGPFTTIRKLLEQTSADKNTFALEILDRFALKIGNLLLKNPLDEAGIEMVGEGAEMEVKRETAIAVTGGSFDVKLNGEPIPQWHTLCVSEGDILSVGISKFGWRCYICAAGGIRKVRESGLKAVSPGGKKGKSQRSSLKKREVLITGTSAVSLNQLIGRKVRDTILPRLQGERELRIILMPPYEHLKDESKEVFLNSSYRLSSDSSLVNYQFEGPRLLFKDEVQRDAVFDRSYAQNGEYTSGIIYVMADGEMIYAGSDFVSAKGYKDRIEIARLIIPDVDRVAQLRPEDHIKFKVVTQDDARSIFDYSIGLISETNILSM